MVRQIVSVSIAAYLNNVIDLSQTLPVFLNIIAQASSVFEGEAETALKKHLQRNDVVGGQQVAALTQYPYTQTASATPAHFSEAANNSAELSQAIIFLSTVM